MTSQPTTSSTGSGFGSAIIQGLGFGVGSAVAHRAVDGIHSLTFFFVRVVFRLLTVPCLFLLSCSSFLL
jgi:hypothetical protein